MEGAWGQSSPWMPGEVLQKPKELSSWVSLVFPRIGFVIFIAPQAISFLIGQRGISFEGSEGEGLWFLGESFRKKWPLAVFMVTFEGFINLLLEFIKINIIKSMNSRVDISPPRTPPVRNSALRKQSNNTAHTSHNNVRFQNLNVIIDGGGDVPDISVSNPIGGCAEDYSLPSISMRTPGLGYTTGTSNNRTSTNIETMRRVIILGDQQVGKTSIVKRIVDETFVKEYEPTTKFDFYFKKILVVDNFITVQLYDTSGQDRYNSLPSSLYKRTDSS
ncbi:hypothetical protein FGO68_gene10573 [Halteria grandinella]|uniref:Uncharacterized protein n=1 Tax=Halteria grandinella TaxID=5974 RepID=A0A8J8T8U6_HALGN|nr:hypothetical protein FGO68_gene10573 [Halteria grandinella]